MSLMEFLADKTAQKIAADREIQVTALFKIYNHTWDKVYLIRVSYRVDMYMVLIGFDDGRRFSCPLPLKGSIRVR